MNCKKKGSKNERKSIKLLETAGYTCTKAGGSLGVFDIIGIGSQDIVLLQVKSNQFPGTAEMEAIRGFTAPSNCRKLVHRWRDYARMPDVKEV